MDMKIYLTVTGIVNFDFEIKYQQDKIEVKDVNKYKAILDLGVYGMTRTHWAVKDTNLMLTLKDLEGYRSSWAFQRKAYIGRTTKKDIIKKIDSVENFLEIILKKKAGENKEIFYRGHADKNYELVPSLFRSNENGTYRLPKEWFIQV